MHKTSWISRGKSIFRPIAAGFVLVLSVSPAYADDSGIVTFGYIHSFVFEPKSQAGNGVEATFVYYDPGMPDGFLGRGGFVKVQGYSPAHLALDVGPQLNVGPIGLELGYAYRGPSEADAAMHGIRIGPFLSASFLVLGGHAVVPVAASGNGEEQGTEVAVTLALKAFVPAFGDVYDLRFPSGLPLRVGADPLVAGESETAAWLEEFESDRPDVSSDELGAWLAARWLDDGLAEHAAVAAFGRLSLSLISLGAPPQLVEDAQRASLDEIRHARLCFSLAEIYSGVARGPAPLRAALSPLEPASLEQLAIRCLCDGCLGEGFAAALAELSGRRASHPRVRSALAEIARDEHAHSELAWRILDWCLAEGGAPMRASLHQVLVELPQLMELVPVPPAFAIDEASRHGRVNPVEQMQAFLATRERVVERLRARLGTALAQ